MYFINFIILLLILYKKEFSIVFIYIHYIILNYNFIKKINKFVKEHVFKLYEIHQMISLLYYIFEYYIILV